MRPILFLSSILLIVTCGCGKKSAPQPSGTISNQIPEPVSAPVAPEAPYEVNQDTNTTFAFVDMVIQNKTTNNFTIDVVCASGILKMLFVEHGETVTNHVKWLYWPDMYFSLHNMETDIASPDVVTLRKVNEKIPIQKHVQLRFNIPNPFIVNVDEDNIEISD